MAGGSIFDGVCSQVWLVELLMDMRVADGKWRTEMQGRHIKGAAIQILLLALRLINLHLETFYLELIKEVCSCKEKAIWIMLQLQACIFALTSKGTDLSDREVKYPFSQRKQIPSVLPDGTWMLHCSSHITRPGTATQWLHTEDYILSDNTLSNPLFQSIPPIISQLVTHRGDVVFCFMNVYAPSGALRLNLTINTCRQGFILGRNKKNKNFSQGIAGCVFNGVTYGSAECFSYLV